VAVNVAYRKRPANLELNFVLALARLSCAPPASAVRLPSFNKSLDCVLVVFRKQPTYLLHDEKVSRGCSCLLRIGNSCIISKAASGSRTT
jgi:hypothetical protein